MSSSGSLLRPLGAPGAGHDASFSTKKTSPIIELANLEMAIVRFDDLVSQISEARTLVQELQGQAGQLRIRRWQCWWILGGDLVHQGKDLRRAVLKAGRSVGARKYMWWMFINVDVYDAGI